MKISSQSTIKIGFFILFLSLQIQLMAQFSDQEPPIISHQPKRWAEWGKKNNIEAIIGDMGFIESVEITFQHQNSKAKGVFPVDKRWDRVPAVVKALGQTPLYSKPNEQSTIRAYVDPSKSLKVLRVSGPFYLVISSDRKAGFILASQTITSLEGKAYRITLPANFCKKSEIKYQIHATDTHGNQASSDVYTLSFKTKDEIVALMQGKKPPKRKQRKSNDWTPSYSASKNYFGGLALTLKVGTLGGGLGLAKSLSPNLNARIAYNYFKYNKDGTYDTDDTIESLGYDVHLNLKSISGLVDYFPFGQTFHLTGGVLYNNNLVKGTGTPLDSYEAEGNVYTPEQIGALNINLESKSSWTPYIGLGFGNPLAFGRKVNLFMDIGTLYMGSPDVKFTAEEESMIYPTTSQDAQVEENIKNIKWYPVFQLGLSVQL